MSEDTHYNEYIKKLEAEISRFEEYIHCNELCKWTYGVPVTPGWYFLAERLMV